MDRPSPAWPIGLCVSHLETAFRFYFILNHWKLRAFEFECAQSKVGTQLCHTDTSPSSVQGFCNQEPEVRQLLRIWRGCGKGKPHPLPVMISVSLAHRPSLKRTIACSPFLRNCTQDFSDV